MYSISQHKDPSWSGYGVVSLCFAAAAFVTAPFLFLLPVASFIPAVLAAAGSVFAWIGLRESDCRPGLAVAGLVVSVMLFGLTVVLSVSDYPELQKAIGHIKLVLLDPGGKALLGLLAGALLVAGGLLLRRRQS